MSFTEHVAIQILLVIRRFFFAPVFAFFLLSLSSLTAQKKSTHYPPLHERLPYLNDWSDDEFHYQLKKCLQSSKVLQQALSFFASEKHDLMGADFASGKSSRQNQFILIISKHQLNSSLRMSFHGQDEILAITHALHLVYDYRFSDLFYKVIPFVAYPSEKVREAAYQALKLLGDDRMLPILMSLAQSPEAVNRIFAIKAFVALDERRALAYLVESLHDPNSSVRVFALEALQKFHHTKSVPQFVKMAKSDESLDVRVQAMKFLRRENFADHATLYSLSLRLLDDDEKRMRLAALSALEQLQNPQSLRFLLSRTSSEKDCEVLEKLYRVIFLLSRQEGKKLKGLGLSSQECSPSSTVWQIYTFLHWTMYPQEHYLFAYLFSPYSQVRQEAAWALFKLNAHLEAETLQHLKKMALDRREIFAVRASVLYLLQSQISTSEKELLSKELQKEKGRDAISLMAILLAQAI